MVDPVEPVALRRPDVDRFRYDIDYLRERVDRIYDEVHKSKKTDWVALGSVGGVIVTIGIVFGNLALSPIAEKLTDHSGRIARLEQQIADMPMKIEAIAKDKVNDLETQINHKKPTQ